MAHAEERKVVSFSEGGSGHGVGAELRSTRVRGGYELPQVSDSLRIRHRHLQAIEEGDFDSLPGPAYAVGFVRSYANWLGLDGEEFVRRFKEEMAGFSPQQDLRFPEPPPEGRLPRGIVVVLSLAIAVGVYMAWQYAAGPHGSDAPPVAEVPERLASPDATPLTSAAPAIERSVGAPAAGDDGNRAAEDAAADVASVAVAGRDADGLSPSTQEGMLVTAVPESPLVGDSPEIAVEGGTETASEAALPADAASEVEAPSASEEGGARPPVEDAEVAAAEAQVEAAEAPSEPVVARLESGQPERQPSAESTSAIPPPPETGDYVPRVYGQGNTDSRVVLRARSDSWVQVQGSDNELLLTRILRTGDTYHVPNRRDLVLITGNAGGLEVLVDGEPAPPLGSSGSVMRNVSLDPARLLAGTAQP